MTTNNIKEKYEEYKQILREEYPSRKYNYPFSQKSYDNLKKQVEKLEARKNRPAKESQGVRQGKIVSLKGYLKSLSLTLFMLTQEPYNYVWLSDTNFRNIKNEQLNRIIPILEDILEDIQPVTEETRKKTSTKKTRSAERTLRAERKTSKKTNEFADIIFLEEEAPEIIFIENDDIWIEGHLDVNITMKRETGKPFEINYRDILGKVYKLKNGKKLRHNGKILTKDTLDVYIYDAIQNRIDNYTEGTGYEIQYEQRKITFVPKKEKPIRLLQNIRMKNQIYRYSKMNDYSYNNNKCVIDTFYNMFHNIYKSINYPLLEEQFLSVMPEGSKIEDGITCIDIENFLRKYYKFVSMYAVDPLGNTFYKYKPIDCRHSLVFRLNGEHIYPIEDSKEKHIVERGGSLLSRYKYNLDINEKNYTYFDISTECDGNSKGNSKKEIFRKLYEELSLNEVDDKLNHKKYLIISGIDNLLEFSIYFIKKSQYYIDYYKFEEGILTSFVNPQNERIILINNDYEQCMEVVNLLSERIEGYSFSNQSLATLSSIWFESFNPKLKKSEYNLDTLETINIHAKAPLVEQLEELPVGKLEESTFKAYDINKSYTHALISETEEYPIYSIMDTFERFNPHTDEIKPGEYLLHENAHDIISIWFKSRKCQFNPFNGKLLYNSNLIKFMLSVKMISKHDIIKYLEPSYTINSDTFKSYVNDVYNSGLDEKICKKLINNFVGMLGRKMSTVTKSCITDNVEIKDFYYDRNCVVDTIYEEDTNDEDTSEDIHEDINENIDNIYIVKDETKHRLLQDNVGIYNTIIDRGIINILSLFLEIFKTGNVKNFISFQTDYIAYEILDDVPSVPVREVSLGSEIGQYKLDKYKLLKRAKKIEDINLQKTNLNEYKVNRFINKETKLNEISFIKNELEELKNETEENYISLKYSDYETELKNKLSKIDRFGLHVNKQQLKLNCKIYIGSAGFGKTYRLCNEMINTESSKIICLTPTAASRENVSDILMLLKNTKKFPLLDFDQFFISAISTYSKVALLDGITHLFIDEVFMVSKYFITLVHFINREFPTIKIICAGDHEQCLSVERNSYDYYYVNGFMKLFGEIVQLEYIKDCARYDEVLKNILDTMRMDENGKYNYDIKDIIAKFPITKDIKVSDIDYNSVFICKKNITKRTIDNLCMNTIIKKYNLPYKTLKYEGKEIQKQNINMFVGMKVICRVNNKYTKDVETKKTVPTFNSQTFTVSEINEDNVILHNEKMTVSIDFVNFMKYFEMSYANTVYRWQGKSINQPFIILDTLTKREAYVALSRSTKYEYITLHSSFNISNNVEKQKEIVNISDRCFIGYIYLKDNKIYKHTSDVGSKVEFKELIQRNYYTCEQDFTNDFQRLMKEHKKKIDNKYEKLVSTFELKQAINIHKLKLNDIKNEVNNNRIVLVYRIDNRGYRKSIRYNKIGYDTAMIEMNEFIKSLKNEYE